MAAEPTPTDATTPAIVKHPGVYLVSRQTVNTQELERFLADEGYTWDYADRLDWPSELVVETAGRLCYLSYGTGRSDLTAYVNNILASRHGSVLEHAVWGFILTGISRSLTHELVRHRAGMAYSQLSQRYVDESKAKFVMPPAIQGHPEEEERWVQEVTDDLRNYRVDFTKIQRVLGFRCVVPLDEGVREMVEAVRRGEVTNWRDPIYSNVKTLQQAGGLEVLKFERPEDKLPQEMPATQRFLKKAG